MLVGSIVSNVLRCLNDLAESQPCGWLAQYTMTYAAQRLSGMTMIMTTYTGVRRPFSQCGNTTDHLARPLYHHPMAGLRQPSKHRYKRRDGAHRR
jgi:hypothetical protein